MRSINKFLPLYLPLFCFSNSIPQKSNNCNPPTQDHQVSFWTQCQDDPDTGYQRFIGYSRFQTRVKDAQNYCKYLKTYYHLPGETNLVSIPDEQMDTCVNDTFVSVKAAGYKPMASLGAYYNDGAEEWQWADGVHVMSSSEDYNNCDELTENGMCDRSEYGFRCLLAHDSDDEGYHWDTYGCNESHVNFLCEYSCNPN